MPVVALFLRRLILMYTRRWVRNPESPRPQWGTKAWLRCLCDILSFFFSSSSPQAFPIIWGRRNGIECHASNLFCSVGPPPLTPHFPYLFYRSRSTWCSFCLPLRLFPGVGASNILLNMCPSSLLLTCPTTSAFSL